jgi:hypothetical protein
MYCVAVPTNLIYTWHVHLLIMLPLLLLSAAAVAVLCMCLCHASAAVFAEAVDAAKKANDNTSLVELVKQYLASGLLALKTLHSKVRMVLPVALAVLAVRGTALCCHSKGFHSQLLSFASCLAQTGPPETFGTNSMRTFTAAAMTALTQHALYQAPD